jgi:hypothetical protein
MENLEDFYFRYLCDTKIPRDPQTQPMSIGSAFDAYVKSYLHTSLFGQGYDLRFELGTLFEEQVEPYNRDWAWKHGEIVFEEYKKSGCLADLMLELNQAVAAPRFEFTIQDKISSDVGEIPLLGKPDIFFINSMGARVVYDWKVNGYCSPRLKSPMKGYVKLRTQVQGSYYPEVHKKCQLLNFKGILINSAMFLEDGNKDWADQLAIYAWLLGEEIGSEEIIFGIDQVCGPDNRLRFASHRLKISPEYQYNLFALVKQVWSVIESGHIFRDMSAEQSRARCELLDKRAEAMVGGDVEVRSVGGLDEANRDSFNLMVN